MSDDGISAMAETSFTESADATEYRIRLVEDLELLNDENKTIVSMKYSLVLCKSSLTSTSSSDFFLTIFKAGCF